MEFKDYYQTKIEALRARLDVMGGDSPRGGRQSGKRKV